MGSDSEEPTRQQFLTEAHELVERLSHDLLLLDRAERGGESTAELLRDLFRAVHTLKGLSGMFGFTAVARLAHELEDLLEHLRMGRAAVTDDTLDVLFHGVERFQQLLGMNVDPDLNADEIVQRLRVVTQTSPGIRDVLLDFAFEPSMLAALTAYEEERLRRHVEEGLAIYRFRVALEVERVKPTLAQIRQCLHGKAEVVACLPDADAQEGAMAFDLLIAARLAESELAQTLAAFAGNLFAVRKRVGASLSSGRLSELQLARPTGEQMLAAATTPTTAVRVDVRKLDRLMDAVGDLGAMQHALHGLLGRIGTAASSPELALQARQIERRLAHGLNDVREATLAVRMVPLAPLFEKLALLVRKLGHEQHKDVKLVVTGADIEIDKLVAEEIADPLVHLIRNAVDHGIESSDERLRKGKSASATIHVQASVKGGEVVIEIHDDGRGIDPVLIRRAAVECGLLPAAERRERSRAEVFDLLFVPGFSTSTEVSDLSGRGMGLDVVRTKIERLSGSVRVQSDLASGTTFVLTAPLTLAILRALVCSVQDRKFALALSQVQEVARLDARALTRIEGHEVLDWHGTTLPLVRLGALLRFRTPPAAGPDAHVIVLAVAERRMGLVVDALHGHQDVMIKPLGPSLRGTRFVAGATDLGDPQLGLMLDAGALIGAALDGVAA